MLAIYIRCRYAMDQVLNDMERQPNEPTTAFRRLIHFCKCEPLRVWTGHPVRDGERTARLLRLCLHHKAREEGLALLELLATDFEAAAIDARWQHRFKDVFFVGIGRKHAELIADFECRVAGNLNLIV